MLGVGVGLARDYIGIVDASGHGVSGVILGKLSLCTPVVFQWEWPDDIK
jgi:hypothetical protein